MSRIRGDRTARGRWLMMAAITFFGSTYGGPLGPLPGGNVTSSDLGLTTEAAGCARGSTVYKSGERFAGVDPCERCACAGGDVTCTREVCAPRPGCKAVHRPDHCCPTYQCECEQEGRVYGNGEKLVDPQDPCRVCYCQGGEVVCRRIACFVRDDCRPRLVPGRCCPEYDNCPLRGVTAVPGISASGSPAIEDVGTTLAPSAPPEKVKQEITIKEITPVSEIPVITDVKIKEILPSPSVEVIEYPSSSKAPLIPREATTEKSLNKGTESQTLTPTVYNTYSSSTFGSVSTAPASTQNPEMNVKVTEGVTEMRPVEDLFPSKISFSKQDAINSDIYPSNSPSVATSITSTLTTSTTKAPVIEEEEQPVFEHNPAFPPLPDDLSVLRNHEDENSPDPSVSMDTDHNEHVIGHDVISSAIPPAEVTTSREVPTTVATVTTTTTTTTPAPTTAPPTTVRATTVSPTTDTRTTKLEVTSSTSRTETTTTQQAQANDGNPMLNLRSALPTEILSVPSSISEVITGELDELEEATTKVSEIGAPITSTNSSDIVKDVPKQILEVTTGSIIVPTTIKREVFDTTTFKAVEDSTSSIPEEITTSFIPKSNVATEVTSQTELSSIPIETSDQHPPANSVNDEKIKVTPTEESLTVAPTSIKIITTEAEPITVSRNVGTVKDTTDSVETTEFVITSFGSSESTNSPVELIKISNEPSAKSAAIIKSPSGYKNSVLTDLFNLVGDVASISNHTSATSTKQPQPTSAAIPDSEELIPVNAGYKSKINNFNLNSITEVPLKSKSPSPSKVKGVEIEDDEAETITDLPAPSKAEPTTRRPIIDNVNDDTTQKEETEEKDIEIITKSYVPSIPRRPTKVVMKSEPAPAVVQTAAASSSAEVATPRARSAATTAH